MTAHTTQYRPARVGTNEGTHRSTLMQSSLSDTSLCRSLLWESQPISCAGNGIRMGPSRPSARITSTTRRRPLLVCTVGSLVHSSLQRRIFPRLRRKTSSCCCVSPCPGQRAFTKKTSTRFYLLAKCPVRLALAQGTKTPLTDQTSRCSSCCLERLLTPAGSQSQYSIPILSTQSAVGGVVHFFASAPSLGRTTIGRRHG